MGAFCALYGGVLSVNPTTGGAPQTMAAYLAGVIVALTYFMLAFLVASVVANFAPKRLPSRALVLGLTIVIVVAVAHYLGTSVRAMMAGWYVEAPQHALSPAPLALMCGLGLVAMLLLEREQAAAKALHEADRQRLDADRQMAEAQLQAFQSQIEPHFLFNSLAHVRRLYQTDPPAGRATMQHLSRYVSRVMPLLRETSIGLREDVDLAVAYLNVQKIRLGARLTFEIDVPPEAGEARVPPLTITTLVENAIKHGISPLSEGGLVRIVARRNGQTASAQVSDTGQGFQTSLGAGVGLANIRARLATLHGAAAALSLCHGTPRGVIATVVVPVRSPASLE